MTISKIQDMILWFLLRLVTIWVMRINEANFCHNFTGYLTWGLLIALQPPFYPYEAEQKGATPQQVLKLRFFDAIKII